MAEAHALHPPKLEYQPALPLPNGKLFLWLFLSTEIMFFAASDRHVHRVAVRCRDLAATHAVHLSEPIGAFNTFVLICSSVTIVLVVGVVRSGKQAPAKFWLAADLALGTVFLGVKMYEYNAKFAHGIYPACPAAGSTKSPT